MITFLQIPCRYFQITIVCCQTLQSVILHFFQNTWRKWRRDIFLFCKKNTSFYSIHSAKLTLFIAIFWYQSITWSIYFAPLNFLAVIPYNWEDIYDFLGVLRVKYMLSSFIFKFIYNHSFFFNNQRCIGAIYTKQTFICFFFFKGPITHKNFNKNSWRIS